ncbi:MAG TPA: carboxypeptidase-like regulatory domain-containing protein [Puia sp.]|nr:carboxypeptidase-like regulatory domain-containing protein [Puia sp.]
MKQFCILSISVLFVLIVYSQDQYFSVSGKIIDDKTKQPMPNASVFCQNTTVGTITNAEGNFSLRLKNGGYDLVISYTGYQTKSMRISNGNAENENMTIDMQEQDKSLTEVVVAGSAEVADGWNKYGQFFLENFIGTSPNAAQCNIENKDQLKFYFYKKRNKLKVKAAGELLIANNALGYKIKYQLDSFVYDYTTKIGSYTGYPLFEEMQGTPEQQDAWNKNRFSAYIGSRLHFMRSWYDSTLHDEGFTLELLDANNSPTQLENPYDSQYYAVDSGDVVVSIKGRLRVNYNNHVPERKYLIQNNFPLTTPVQISALDIIDGFTIEENGYFYEQSEVTNMGYWAWKKLAEALPYDYNPQ